MKIEFTLTPADQLALFEYASQHDRQYRHADKRLKRARYQYLLIYGGIGLMLAMELWNRSRAHQTLSLPFAMLAVMWGLFMVTGLKELRDAQRRLRQSQHFSKMIEDEAVDPHGEKTSLELLPDHLLMTTKHTLVQCMWAGAVDSVVSTPAHLFIYLNSSQAIIVPESAFLKTAEFGEFASLARDYLRAGGGPQIARELRKLGEQRELRCPECGYSLNGIVGTRCSECGYRVALADFSDRPTARSFRLQR
jgi:DNA-directed RNA polymerase subunit RPC12/RpoP